MSIIGKRIGRRIRELRTAGPERWTQEALAERAHISVSFLSMIERGERVPHLETLESLAEALGVAIPELFVDANPTDLGDLVRPLRDFIRSRKLGPEDVDKLLGVARAMFSSPQAKAAATVLD